MAELVVLVLPGGAKAGEVREAWLKAGVSGTTMFSSMGLAQPASQPSPPDDLPLFPSLQRLLRSQAEPGETLFAVVPDGFDVEMLATSTEAITGALGEPNQGLLFVVSVRPVRGPR